MNLKPVNLNHPEGLQAALAEVCPGYGKGSRFLCQDGISLFVSRIRLFKKPDWSIKQNCENGCLAVDNVEGKELVPINDLHSLYYIEGGNFDWPKPRTTSTS